MDSNQGYNPYKLVICPLTRVINLHITSYLPYPEALSITLLCCFVTFLGPPIRVSSSRVKNAGPMSTIPIPRAQSPGVSFPGMKKSHGSPAVVQRKTTPTQGGEQ